MVLMEVGFELDKLGQHGRMSGTAGATTAEGQGGGGASVSTAFAMTCRTHGSGCMAAEQDGTRPAGDAGGVDDTHLRANGIFLINGHFRTARRNAGSETGAPENALNDAPCSRSNSIAHRGRHVAFGDNWRLKLLGKPPSAAVRSQEDRQTGECKKTLATTLTLFERCHGNDGASPI